MTETPNPDQVPAPADVPVAKPRRARRRMWGAVGNVFAWLFAFVMAVAVLGVGKIEKRARVLTSADGEDYIAIRQMAFFALSFDHRIIDGSDAEKFLAYIKDRLEGGQFAI